MNIFSDFTDMIYPPRCHICGSFLLDKAGQVPHFCEACLNSFPGISHPFCPICRVPFGSLSEEDHLCETCLRKRPYFKYLGAPYLYKGRIMEAVHQFKYEGKTHLSISLGSIMASFTEEWLNDNDMEDLLLIPVPLHPKRLRERKFNQSLLLARSIMKSIDLELDFLSLRRIKYTIPQIGLNNKDRKKNVRGAFKIVGEKSLKDRNVVLVDDVATTGSTLNECARVLKKAGCKNVLCLVLARTSAY